MKKVFQFKTTVCETVKPIATPREFSDFYEAETMDRAAIDFMEDLHRFGLPLDKLTVTVQQFDDNQLKGFGLIYAFNPATSHFRECSPFAALVDWLNEARDRSPGDEKDSMIDGGIFLELLEAAQTEVELLNQVVIESQKLNSTVNLPADPLTKALHKLASYRAGNR